MPTETIICMFLNLILGVNIGMALARLSGHMAERKLTKTCRP